MKPVNFAPVYLGIYPELAELVRSHGYALAAYGSLARDFDLICIPWVENPSKMQDVVDDIVSKFSLRQVGEPEVKFHNRIVYTIVVSYDTCYLDLSFMSIEETGIKDIGMTHYCLGHGVVSVCNNCDHLVNWEAINRLPDILRKQLQSKMTSINSTDCILSDKKWFK